MTIFGIEIFIHVVEHDTSLYSFHVLSGTLLPTFPSIRLVIEALGKNSVLLTSERGD